MALSDTRDCKIKCCLKSCSLEISPSDGHTDVRAFEVSQDEKVNLVANWQDGGDAIFHRPCWNRLHDAANARKGVGDPALSNLEKDLVQEAYKTAEHHDSDEDITNEAARISEFLRSSEHCIVFTGAGISTSAGIGDFRGKDGKWTERDKQTEYGTKGVKKSKKPRVVYRELRPTYSHEAIVKLVEMGYVKYVISQNCDGLHKLSGLRDEQLAELHGNVYVERCEECDARYVRGRPVYGIAQYDVPPKRCVQCGHNHRTGRMCEIEGCGGHLMDTCINFSDNLEEHVLNNAVVNAKKSDLVICLGSSLMVSPANSLVKMGKKPTRLVMCVRQITDYDSICYETSGRKLRSFVTGTEDGITQNGSRIFGDCDRLMRLVLKNMLPADDLERWESERGRRMAEYDTHRRT